MVIIDIESVFICANKSGQVLLNIGGQSDAPNFLGP